MRRTDYLGLSSVQGFVDWGSNIVRGEWGLQHAWQGSKRVGQLKCNTLYQAYKGYFWNDECFFMTARKLDDFRGQFKRAIDDDDNIRFATIAEDVKYWGRIGNATLRPNVLRERAELLNPRTADTEDLRAFGEMRSIDSKIYSLLVDGLPIYDSRTACGLASLIWLFCKDRGYCPIPDALKIGIPSAHVSFSRNPDESFPGIHSGFKYADSNLKAAWILGDLLETAGGFGHVPTNQQLLALQSALFMLGYKPLADDAVRKDLP